MTAYAYWNAEKTKRHIRILDGLKYQSECKSVESNIQFGQFIKLVSGVQISYSDVMGFSSICLLFLSIFVYFRLMRYIQSLYISK